MLATTLIARRLANRITRHSRLLSSRGVLVNGYLQRGLRKRGTLVTTPDVVIPATMMKEGRHGRAATDD